MRRFALLLLLAASLPGNAESEVVAPIPVVQTWGDLISHAPLSVQSDQLLLPDGAKYDPKYSAPVKVRIGISDDNTPNGAGVLVYCLARGVAFAGDFTPSDLGPFTIVVHAANAKAALLEQMQARQLSRSSFTPTTYAFTAQSVSLAAAGDYVVELIQRYRADPKTAPKVIARTTVHVGGQPVHPWSPWGETGLQALIANPPTVVSSEVTNPTGATAIPKTDQQPWFLDELPWLDTALPQLVPEEPDPQTHLAISGKMFVLTAANLDWWDPQDHCLTRWWVNGKPWTPPYKFQMEKLAVNDSGAQPAGSPSAYHFQLEFHPKRLGAKKGDTIALQVLYCPNRYVLTGLQEDLAQVAMAADSQKQPPANYSSMSNRVSFIYSGDPNNPMAP